MRVKSLIAGNAIPCCGRDNLHYGLQVAEVCRAVLLAWRRKHVTTDVISTVQLAGERGTIHHTTGQNLQSPSGKRQQGYLYHAKQNENNEPNCDDRTYYQPGTHASPRPEGLTGQGLPHRLR